MKNKMRMIKAEIGVRCVSCFVGPPATILASPATLNLFDNPAIPTSTFLGEKNVLIQD